MSTNDAKFLIALIEQWAKEKRTADEILTALCYALKSILHK